MSKLAKFGYDLYSGERSFNVVGRRWMWYAISAVLLAVVIVGLVGKGLNLGIDFTGGTRYTVTVTDGAGQELADDLREAVGDTGIEAAEGATVRTAGEESVVVETRSIASNSADDQAVIESIEEATGVDRSDISRTGVGPSWGERVATKAGLGLGIFLVGVVLFIWVYFREWKMSVAAVAALFHDIGLTVGIYAIAGFEVTPATVTGFLTILGYSLYDTVVVFDKVKENTQNLGSSHLSYGAAANLAVNQTLVRSINTSIVGLLPVVAILYVSAVQLGTSSLKDISLVLFVGMAVGTYSSLVIATPLLVHLKQGEQGVKDADRHARARAKADPYANVPAYVDDDAPAAVPENPDELEDGPDRGSDDSVAASTTPRADPLGKGRNAPSEHGPVEESRSSGRRQPSRKPRSKRK